MVFCDVYFIEKYRKYQKVTKKCMRRIILERKSVGIVQEIRQREIWKKICEIIGNLQLVVRIRGGNIFKNS